MKHLSTCFIFLTLSIISYSQPATVKWAGVRSSSYGIDPFPNSLGWATATSTMAGYFPGSQPTIVWLVGEIYFSGQNSGMDCYFPNPGGTYDSKIHFSSTDRYKTYFDYFDSIGVKVFLQVESGFAPMGDLIDAVLKQYSSHSCVIGFGVDVEWYNSSCDGCNNASVTDSAAQSWETKVKSYKSSYKLFLKHFDKGVLPPKYRGDIVYVNDSQGYSSKSEFVSDMKDFADFFYPCDVMFQFGYDEDKKWWNLLTKPIPQNIGQSLVQVIKQNCGIIWVDFTLRSVLPLTPTFISIPESKTNEQLVYPNPTQGLVNIKPGNGSSALIDIYNCVGMNVASLFWRSQDGAMPQVDLSHYGRGVYFIKIQSDNENNVYKVVVK
jgi:hypothetical protein